MDGIQVDSGREHSARAPAGRQCQAASLGTMIAKLTDISNEQGATRRREDHCGDGIEAIVSVMANTPSTSAEGAYAQAIVALGAACTVSDNCESQQALDVVRLLDKVVLYFETQHGFRREGAGLEYFRRLDRDTNQPI